MNEQVTHITTITDHGFFAPVMVMLTSAKVNMAAGSRYHAHVFYQGLEAYEVAALQQLATQHFEISLCELPEQRWSQFAAEGDFPPIVMARFELPLLLPDLERVLYLDGDIVVHRDLSALYAMPLEGAVLAAVRDWALAGAYSDATGIADSINSGVVVMDLQALRAGGYVERFYAARTAAPASWKYPDQDVLSHCCAGKIKFLPPRYNGLLYVYRRAVEKQGLAAFNAYYGTAYGSLEALQSEFVLTHLAGTPGCRPWEALEGVCRGLWEHYWRLSPMGAFELVRCTQPRLNHEWRCVLLGFIPLLAYRYKCLPQRNVRKLRVLLFCVLPLLTARGTMDSWCWKLLGLIPVWRSSVRALP